MLAPSGRHSPLSGNNKQTNKQNYPAPGRVSGGNFGSSKSNGIWGPLQDGDEYLTEQLTKHSRAFIARARGGPFFLYLSYNAPHSPLQGRASDRPRLVGGEPEPLKLYASMVMAVDDGVGEIVLELQRLDLRNKTLIAIASDNGPAKTNFQGMPEDWPKDLVLGSTGELSGGKGSCFDGGIKVPS